MAGSWKAGRLGDICRTIYRYPTFYGMEKHSSGVPVIRGEHLLDSGRISTDWKDYWFVSKEYAAQFPKTELEEHDIVMSVRGTVGQFAERFTEEHRAALDWLNEHTAEGVNFFGLEVELWRIGDSPFAPKFNVVSKPNEWTKAVIQTRDNSELNTLCADYWTGVLDALGPFGILTSEGRAVRKQDIEFPVGWDSFRLKAYFSRPQKKVGVWVNCRGARGHEHFETLRQSKEQIETALGDPLDWNPDEPKNRGTCIRIFSGVDPTDRNDWARQHKFIAEKLVALYRAVASIVARLDAPKSPQPSVGTAINP